MFTHDDLALLARGLEAMLLHPLGDDDDAAIQALEARVQCMLALEDWHAGREAEWPRYTSRKRWQTPNGRTYATSSLALDAMRKVAS